MFFYANHHALESSIFMGVTTFVEEIHEQMFFFEETELSAVAFAWGLTMFLLLGNLLHHWLYQSKHFTA